MERGPTSKTIHYDKVVSQLPTFVIENGPEEFNRFKDIILQKREEDPEYLDTQETAGHSVKAWLTKWDTHETDERFKPIGDYALYVLDYIMRHVIDTEAEYRIVSLWAVVMEPGDQALPHDHLSASWSCVYYIDVEDDVAPIFLEDKEVHVKNGMMVLFPGLLTHFVPPTKGRRIAVAMNIDKICLPM
jgi:hypothetical protein